MKRSQPKLNLSGLLILVIILFTTEMVASQAAHNRSILPFVTKNNDLFGMAKTFITNIGQYDDIPKGYTQEKILFGYEGMGGMILFTKKGIVQVQRKELDETESSELRAAREKEKQEDKESEEREKWMQVQKVITMEWKGANSNVQIIAEEPTVHHYTYNLNSKMAKGYGRIVYKEIYPGIDLVFSFRQGETRGVEYSLEVKPGADISKVQFVYGGDLKTIAKEARGDLVVQTDIEATRFSAPKSFYNDRSSVETGFSLTGRTIKFSFPKGYNKTRAITIDPFISSANPLTSQNVENNGVAKDIDFDYDGNIYVSGGGNAQNYILAKYDAGGTLQWIFTGGSISSPGPISWNFGLNYGGFVVDKTSGKSYLGQGWNTPGGVQVIRLNANGLYDNYITAANSQFQEGWRLIWNCNSGSPQILIAGGGQSSPLDFGVISPPSTGLSTQNITGLPGNSQDIADAVIDPKNHELYTLFAHGYAPPNDLYKHVPPYLPANIAWNKPSVPPPGFTALVERQNRPYLLAGAGNDNSVNSLAISDTYLFYWNGRELRAFNKNTGDQVGNTLTTTDTVLRQGGIIADACGNVFVGSQSGLIKVYKFSGANFDDAAAPDINVIGYQGYNSVYDLAYDDARRMLYACGRGFVASFDVSSYCALATYDVDVVTSCTLLTAKATIKPTPAAGSTVTYYLYKGTTQLSSNTTGNFSGLSLETNYTVRVIVNQECSGIQTAKDFTIKGPVLSVVKTDECGGNGKITITPFGGVLPYKYSIDGGVPQASNVFSGLVSGNYVITVSDANSCVSTTEVTIVKGSNCVNATATVVDETCGMNNGTITVHAVQGVPPYRYSIDGVSYQAGNVFSGLLGGNYTVSVKDATDGFFSINVSLKTISVNPPLFSFITSIATCGNTDGSIQLTGSAGVFPYTYSIGGDFQSSNVFATAGGDYTVTIKDAVGCMSSQPVTVPQLNDLVIDAGVDQDICEGSSVLLNASSNAVNFTWTPAVGISNTHILKATASPVVTTQYYVKGTKGTCESLDSVIVNVKPAPRPNAGIDTTICYGQSLQLHATGASTYTWTPSTNLNSTTIADPFVTKPTSSITYSVSAIGSNNCPSLNADQVKITVIYKLRIFAGNDTATIVNEPMQLDAKDLNGNSNISYTWTPPLQLSNSYIPNPVFISDHDMRYKLLATTPDGCESSDSLIIKVFLRSDIYVPTAFSPNGDGLNDILKAIPVGMKIFNYFRIYNRWGQMVFATTNPNKGWDGVIGGKVQKTDTYVWMASGVDYKGRKTERKGTVVLVR